MSWVDRYREIASAAKGPWPVRWTPKGLPYIARPYEQPVGDFLEKFDPELVSALLNLAEEAQHMVDSPVESPAAQGVGRGRLRFRLDVVRDLAGGDQ